MMYLYNISAITTCRSDLSPGYLAMECLLVLTSRRSGDWFKEELREAEGHVTRVKKVPRGTSDDQASWIVDSASDTVSVCVPSLF